MHIHAYVVCKEKNPTKNYDGNYGTDSVQFCTIQYRWMFDIMAQHQRLESIAKY